MHTFYIEKQGFNTFWATLFLIPLTLILSLNTYRGVASPLLLGIVWFILLLVIGTIYFSKLHTHISEEGVTVSFFPFLMQPKHIPWTAVKQAYLREYLPLSEYGGWGAPLVHPAVYKGIGSSRAFTTKGKMGLQLTLTDGRTYLIGTQKGDELRQILAEKSLLTV